MALTYHQHTITKKTESATCSFTEVVYLLFQRKQDSEMAEKVKFDISFDVHMADDSLSERKDPLRPGSG